MEESIGLKELFLVLRKRLGLILLITISAVLVSGIVSFFVLTPVYEASTQLLVNQEKEKKPEYDSIDIQADLQLINTYNVIIMSPAILEKVIKDLKLNLTVSELQDKITVQNEQDSQIVNLSVKDTDPNQATKIVNKTAEVFENKIVDIMNVDNVSILAKAVVEENQSPVKPKPLVNIAIAFVLGLMASFGLVFLLEYLDNTIKTEKDIKNKLDLPILGVVAEIVEEDMKGTKAGQQQNTHV